MGRYHKELTPNEELFLEAYVGVAQGSAAKAYKLSYKGDNKGASAKGCALLKRPRIQEALEKFKEKKKKTFWLSEEEILEGLYKEANAYGNGTSHSARIQAWVQLGKHIGMFAEKRNAEDSAKQVTYNIVNYSDGGELKGKIEQGVEAHKEEIVALPDGVEVVDFS